MFIVSVDVHRWKQKATTWLCWFCSEAATSSLVSDEGKKSRLLNFAGTKEPIGVKSRGAGLERGSCRCFCNVPQRWGGGVSVAKGEVAVLGKFEDERWGYFLE